MNNDIQSWARASFPQPINTQVSSGKMNMAKYLAIALMVFLGYIIIGNIVAAVKNPENSMVSTVIAVLLSGLMAGGYLLVNNSRKKLAKVFDTTGITTLGGKQHTWDKLQGIEYHMAKARHSDDKKIRSIHFYFTDGKAGLGYLMDGVTQITTLLTTIPVPKSEKIVQMYRG
jgi:hypothetical protein